MYCIRTGDRNLNDSSICCTLQETKEADFVVYKEIFRGLRPNKYVCAERTSETRVFIVWTNFVDLYRLSAQNGEDQPVAEILMAAKLQHRDGRLCHSGGGWRVREVCTGVRVQDRKPAKLYGRLVNDRALMASRTRLSAAVRLAHHLLTHLHHTPAQPHRPTPPWPLHPPPTGIHHM